MKSSLLPGGTLTPPPTGTPVASTTGFSVPMQAVIAASAAAAARMRARRRRSRMSELRIDRPTLDHALVRREMLEHEHAGAYRRALVEVDHVLVEHADAAGRDVGADRPRLGGAVDAVDEVLAVAVEIVSSGAERVVWPALHVSRQVGAARQHFRGRRPIGPHRLAADLGAPEPLEALFPDADAVAECRVVLEGDVEGVVPRIDDERARRLLVDVLDELAPEARRDPRHVGAPELEATVLGHAVVIRLVGNDGLDRRAPLSEGPAGSRRTDSPEQGEESPAFDEHVQEPPSDAAGNLARRLSLRQRLGTGPAQSAEGRGGRATFSFGPAAPPPHTCRHLHPATCPRSPT